MRARSGEICRHLASERGSMAIYDAVWNVRDYRLMRMLLTCS